MLTPALPLSTARSWHSLSWLHPPVLGQEKDWTRDALLQSKGEARQGDWKDTAICGTGPADLGKGEGKASGPQGEGEAKEQKQDMISDPVGAVLQGDIPIHGVEPLALEADPVLGTTPQQ